LIGILLGRFTVPINTARRPILSASRPHAAAPGIAPIPEDNRMIAGPKLRCQRPTMKASTNPIRKKSKNSSMSPRTAAAMIRH
jgi:hypothetical protein